MMMEITFKTLDRVTVNGLYNKNTVTDITSFAYCVEDNTYYLLDDPIVLQKREDIEVTENGYCKIVIKDKDEAKVSIITCNTLKDVYKQLINRLARNDLNPFILYKKFKEGGYVTGNTEIDDILASVDIPDDIIEEMIEDIAKAEKNHPEMLIYISIDILKGIDEVLKKIKENQELLKDKHMTIKDIINDLTVKGNNYIAYPREHTLARFIEELINDERKKLERLMKKQEQQQQQGSTNQSSSGQQQQLKGGSSSGNSTGSGTGSTAGSNAGMQGSPSPSPSPKPNTGSDNNNNNNNNNSNSSDNIGSSFGSAGFGSGVGSSQLYAYTFRVIVPTNLKRSEVNEIIASIKRIRSDAKVEVV
jgi:hypothetical protein